MKKRFVNFYAFNKVVVLFTESEDSVILNFEIYKYTKDVNKYVFYSLGSSHTTSSIEEAQPYIKGRVKWDGCMDIQFLEQTQNSFVHFCSGEFNELQHMIESVYKYREDFLEYYEG